MEQQIIVSCLGRPMELGMLYDCRSETPVPGVTLWDFKTLRSNSDMHLRESSKYEITADDSMENKAHFMNVEAEVKLSFLGRLLKVEGAGKYLDNNKSSANQARVVLKYSCKSNFEQLTMDHLGMTNIKYPDAFDKGMATHIVTAIEYGADAVFVFDKKLKSSESCREIEGKLKVSLSKIPILKIGKIEGAVDGQLTEDDHQLANSFECTFHGDIVLKENPTTFEDAVAVYKKLPSLIQDAKRQSNIYGVPKKAYLYPLSKLDDKAAKLVRFISDSVVSETQSLLEHIVQTLAVANDLENSDICHSFFGVKQQIVKFKSLLSQFRASFQRALSEMLPEIRGGGMEESKLLKKIQQIRKSPFDPHKLDTWVALKKREFSFIQSYLKNLKPFPFAFQPGELETFTQNDNIKYILCISLASIIGCDHPYLDAMKEYSLDDQDEIVCDAGETLEDSWCDDDSFTTNMQNQVRRFKNFAAANNEKSDVKFVIVGASAKKGKNETPGSIFLYIQGRRQLFQPPEAPGQPQMVSNDENEITIAWPAPLSGVKCVLHYKILYHSTDVTDGDWYHVDTTGPELQFTVTRLAPDTEYVFKIEAISEPGKSLASSQSLPIKTKSMPPLALKIIPTCQIVKVGENGQPTWYQIPIVPRLIDRNPFLRTVNIGQETPASRLLPTKSIINLGSTGSGKTTMCNGFTNYWFGVKREDNFRLQLIPKEDAARGQDKSQTTVITQYIFHWQPQSPFKYNLVLIDPPGYADTEGVEKDEELTRQLKIFFKTAVDHIDAIAFVIKSSDNRLNAAQKYIFDSVVSIFGKDIDGNICLMLTFSDGKEPSVLAAVEKHKIKYNKYFKFNNSVFALDFNQKYDSEKSFDTMFWELAYAGYKDFFTKLGTMKPKSLKLTIQVLEERERLEKTVDILSEKITEWVNKLATMHQEVTFIMEYEAEMEINQKYTRMKDVWKMDKVDTPAGYFVTNCRNCGHTCHDNCAYSDDADKIKCVAMGSDGNCQICDKHCHWNLHCNVPYKFVPRLTQEAMTMEDMKRKYYEASNNLSLRENVLDGILKAYNNVQVAVLNATDQIRHCLERLRDIAMLPADPVNTVQYIDMLISATEKEKKEGWVQRRNQLLNARCRAEMVMKMQQTGVKYDPLEEIKKNIELEAKRAKDNSKGLSRRLKDVVNKFLG